MKRLSFGVLVSSLVMALGCAVLEATFRLLDGYSLSSSTLVLNGRKIETPSAGSYLSRFPLGPHVDADWYALDPDESTGNIPEDQDLQQRRRNRPPDLASVSYYEWNREYVHWAACEHPDFFRVQFGPDVTPVQDLFVFEPVDGGKFPTYRFLRNSKSAGIRVNNFGWRGPDIALNKPPNTIRIAFVGASTTVNPHSDPFSYPDYIRRWFEEWVRASHQGIRIEVINAGRSGINSDSIEAIVRTELLPVNPDVVVYYEGANQFWPVEYLKDLPPNWDAGRPPQSIFKKPGWLDDHSAIALRLDDLIGHRTSEPSKPSLKVSWPADLNENDPDIRYPRLPTNLNWILMAFDGIRTSLAQQGARFAPASFIWCVYDGMRLNPLTNAGVFGYLNGPFWPLPYAHMQRFAAFQNRVFRKYAETYHLPFVDVAKDFPLDPALFGDAIHMSRLGVKLMAWSAFQSLTRQLDSDLRSGALPKPEAVHYASHPSFTEGGRRLMPPATAAAECWPPKKRAS